MRKECRTQEELEAALKAGDYPVLVGNGYFRLDGEAVAELRGSSRAELWGSSSAVLRGSSSAELWESSSAVLWGSSSAVLRGSSSAELWESSRAVLWGNSSAVLWGNSSADAADAAQLRAYDECTIKATPWVAITRHGDKSTIDGGTLIQLPEIGTPVEWCEYYGVEIKTHKRKKYAILFKGVRDDYRSSWGFPYVPGTVPEAPDWDGGEAECGGGLHFSPRPAMTLEFDSEATRFLACPVFISDMTVHPNGYYPQKTKAKGCCLPIWEVDRDGNPIKKDADNVRKSS